jgi:hypothetical protein
MRRRDTSDTDGVFQVDASAVVVEEMVETVAAVG